MIKIDNVQKKYGRAAVLNDINLEINDQEFLCLVGESGSGKTTLLKIIAGLIAATRGEVYIDNKILEGINFDSSMVFQNGALLPWLTAKENVLLPFELTGTNYDQKEIEQLLREVEVHDFENKTPRDLSGGQRQRVGIARALAVKRKILLLDEPFSALDIKTATELRQDLLDLWKTKKLTVIMVSHLVEEAVELADRIVVMKGGQIQARINVDLARPRNPESKEFIKVSDHIKAIIES